MHQVNVNDPGWVHTATSKGDLGSTYHPNNEAIRVKNFVQGHTVAKLCFHTSAVFQLLVHDNKLVPHVVLEIKVSVSKANDLRRHLLHSGIQMSAHYLEGILCSRALCLGMVRICCV